MDNKAQAGPIGFIFFVIVFVILWFVWIGHWLSDVGSQAIIDGSLTGIEAFFYANLNLWVMIGLILGVIGYMYFSAQ
jgi:hypothetical protein